ncbi:MAG: hypothetical protein LHV69_06595 [Elusimicrobia bacterium]|nr:hypothetical protein [Candidatus Obscuribacterium magneticum]
MTLPSIGNWLVALFVLLGFPVFLGARPLVTRETETIGYHHFETGFLSSVRHDTFKSPKTTYRTVVLPAYARLGLFSKADVGVTFRYITNRLERGEAKYTGSGVGQISPEVKIAFTENWGFLGIWHTRSGAQSDDIPVARGVDGELVGLYQAPTAWPLYLNLGYVFRGPYNSNMGVEEVPVVHVNPGSIFQSRAALEIPLSHGFSVLTEMAYYHVYEQKVAGEAIPATEGDALDAYLDVTWLFRGWSLGLGLGVGLLDESHTSFDFERGAGDTDIRFLLAYRVKPHKPQ